MIQLTKKSRRNTQALRREREGLPRNFILILIKSFLELFQILMTIRLNSHKIDLMTISIPFLYNSITYNTSFILFIFSRIF